MIAKFLIIDNRLTTIYSHCMAFPRMHERFTSWNSIQFDGKVTVGFAVWDITQPWLQDREKNYKGIPTSWSTVEIEICH